MHKNISIMIRYLKFLLITLLFISCTKEDNVNVPHLTIDTINTSNLRYKFDCKIIDSNKELFDINIIGFSSKLDDLNDVKLFINGTEITLGEVVEVDKNFEIQAEFPDRDLKKVLNEFVTLSIAEKNRAFLFKEKQFVFK